ncbi:MAG: tetratricopeptide repeat protein [Leptospiraceae bacterium]|nr:tetratricopeptide repeat protein [Leptospiraceae bacterium]
MPVTRAYTGGSIVYFQGDKGDDVYVLQSGRVVLISTAIDSGEEIREEVQVGEFFAVKSSMGRYPREETAQVIGKTTLVVFKLNEFEQFILKNTRLILKMLRVFSKQLRDIHRQVRNILKADSTRDPAYELMNVAESFYRSGNTDHAVYAFERYLGYYPDGEFVSRAKDLLQMARKGQMYPHGYPALESQMGHSPEPLDPSFMAQSMLPAESVDDPFAMPDDDSFGESDGPDGSELLRQGLEHFKNGDFHEAASTFEQAQQISSPHTEAEATAVARCLYELGRTQIKLKQVAEASQTFSTYIKQHPTGPAVKPSIFQLGVIAQSSGNKERAASLFKKVVSMNPPDEMTDEAKKRLEALS